jgi:hypothetical protein
MPAMTTVAIALAVALFVFAQGCMKWGFIVAMRGAAMIMFCVPVFWFVGVLVKDYLGEFGVKAPSVMAWIGIGFVILLVARWVAGKVGWGNVLGWSFSIAVGFSGVVLVLFLFLMMGVVIHATVQGMIFIAVLTVILMGASHKYQSRGR